MNEVICILLTSKRSIALLQRLVHSQQPPLALPCYLLDAAVSPGSYQCQRSGPTGLRTPGAAEEGTRIYAHHYHA